MSGILSDEYFMGLALNLAKEAMYQEEVPIGAVVVTQNGLIIGKGYNQTERLHDVTAHAEMLALTAATQELGAKYLKNCRLYVTVEPCPMCAAALNWAQLQTLVFGATDVKRGYQIFQPSLIHPKTKVISGILEAESAALMKDFFKKKRGQ